MLALTNCYCANDKVNEYVDKARDAWQDGDVDKAIDELGSATIVARHGEISNIDFALAELFYYKLKTEVGYMDANTYKLVTDCVKLYRVAYMFKDQ